MGRQGLQHWLHQPQPQQQQRQQRRQQQHITLADLGTRPVEPQGKHKLRVGTEHRAAIVLGPSGSCVRGGQGRNQTSTPMQHLHLDTEGEDISGPAGEWEWKGLHCSGPQIYVFEAGKAT